MELRFRLFAGPNGSGKTTLFYNLRKDGIIHTDIYVNADKIEEQIKQKGKFWFNAYRVKVSNTEFKKHILSSGLFSSKIKDARFADKFNISKGVLHINIPTSEINSYHASFIAIFLAEKLIISKQSFCFETVLSHPSKIDLLRLAKKHGYKTYLYFLFTDNVQVNIARVALRAKQGLHYVDPSLIKSRYIRSFKNLPFALKAADIAFVIDTSSDEGKIVASKLNRILNVKKSVAQIIAPYLK